MAGDWIKLHRKVIESQVFSDSEVFRLWCYLLLRANYRPSYFRGEKIDVGQVAFSQRMLAETLGVHRTTLQRHLKRLEEMGNVGLRSGHDFTVATIYQWQTYQTADDSGQADDWAADEATGAATDGPPAGHERAAGATLPKKERSLRSERREEGKKPDSPEPPLAPSEPPVLVFPTVGKAKEWGLSQAYINTLCEAFPGLDVLAECKKALVWCTNNSSKRKTPGGMQNFLFGWMGRNQNRGAGRSGPAIAGDPRGNLALREQLLSENRNAS